MNHQDGKTDFPLIESDRWSENWLLYERDLMIQEDLEWFAEAVYQFYQKHLDRLIRENDRMWGDFRKKKHDDDGNELGLELNTWGYDRTDPDVKVPMNKKTIVPDPEAHFSFSSKLMVLAIDLYQHEAPRDFCPYTNFAHKKLTQFVDGWKDMLPSSVTGGTWSPGATFDHVKHSKHSLAIYESRDSTKLLKICLWNSIANIGCYSGFDYLIT